MTVTGPSLFVLKGSALCATVGFFRVSRYCQLTYKWHSFLWSVDQWLVAYASLPILLTSVRLFAIGHALELYLKAANAKMSGDADRAVGFGHDIKALFDDCKELDRSFLPDIQIRREILDMDFLRMDMRAVLSEDDFLSFMKSKELYTVAKLLSDLKYLGAPLKRMDQGYAISSSLDFNWPLLFKEIRSSIGYPLEGKPDPIPRYLETTDLSDNSREFLEWIVE